MLGLKGMLAMGGIMVVMAIGFGWYYKASQARIEAFIANEATYKANEVTLKATIVEVNETVRVMDAQRQTDQATILKISDQFNEARDETTKLRQTFAKHDLNYLSIRKPGLIERIINRGTAKVGREIAEMTNPRREELPTDEPEAESNE